MGGRRLKALLDTHIWIWAAGRDRRIGRDLERRIDRSAATGELFVSAISAWEIALLERRGRLRLDQPAGRWVEAALAAPGLILAPFTPAIAVAAAQLPDSFPGDPADRFIVATALDLGARLLTADERVLDYLRDAAPGNLP